MNYTDIGQSYQHSDDSDHDGIDDALDNCPYVANPDQADTDGDALGNVCDNCAGTPNQDQKPNSCGDVWQASTVGFQLPEVTNNMGMVVGSVCDQSCTPASSNQQPTTVGIGGGTPSNIPAGNTGGSPHSAGEVDCSVQTLGAGSTPWALVLSTLGLSLMGIERRRRNN